MAPNSNLKTKELQTSEKRLAGIKIFFYGLFVVFASRAFWLQTFFSPQNKLNNIKKSQYHKTSNSVSYRGTIFDHRKIPLAISIKTPSFAVNPKVFRPNKTEEKKITQILGLSANKIKQLRNRKGYFAWLKRKVSYSDANKIEELKIKGIHNLLEPARFYPGNLSAAHLIGLVGTDNIGLLGLEKTLNHVLSGSQKEIMKLKDARGQSILTSSSSVAPQKQGSNIFLTIDHVIQETTEEALEKMYRKSQAKSAFAIVADPHTGRILSMANQPSFNPNNTKDLILEHTKNLSISLLMEPGSVVKPLIIASALEQKKISLEQLHDCEKSGVYKVGKNSFIHDDHPKKFYLTTAEVLIYSSNICAFKIAKKLGKKELHQTLKSFGLSLSTPNLSLPGTKAGSLAPWNQWRPIRFANLSFGQGLLTTGIEMIRAYSVFANGGFLINPHLIERIETADGDIIQGPPQVTENRVISQKTAKMIRETLLRVVLEGTGKNAKLENFSAAGKTGTAEKFDHKEKKYSVNKRIASFIGFAPAIDPHLLAYIVIDEPKQKPYYGGTWAAPVFKEIMEKALKYLNIAPKSRDEPIKVNLSKQTDEDEKTSKTKL